MTIPNWITIARIVLVPLILVILLTEMENKEIIAFSIFVIAAVSDSLDGYVARKLNQVTALGKFLDPLADKLLVSAALIALVYLEEVETWVAAAIILREIFISAFRFYSLVKDASFSASIPAKMKTTVQLIAIGVLIIYPRLPFPYFLKIFGTILLYIGLILSYYSAAQYMLIYGRSSNNKK